MTNNVNMTMMAPNQPASSPRTTSQSTQPRYKAATRTQARISSRTGGKNFSAKLNEIQTKLDEIKQSGQNLKEAQQAEQPQVESDATDELKQLPQDGKGTQKVQPQIKSDTTEELKQLPKVGKDTQKVQPQIKSDATEELKQLPKDGKDTQQVQPQIKSDTTEELKQLPKVGKDTQQLQSQIKSDTTDELKQLPQDAKDTQQVQSQIKSDTTDELKQLPKDLKGTQQVQQQIKSDTTDELKQLLQVGKGTQQLQPQIKSDTTEELKQLPKVGKDTQQIQPQIKSDATDELKQLPQVGKDTQQVQSQIKSDATDELKQLPQDGKGTQKVQPQIKSDATEELKQLPKDGKYTQQVQSQIKSDATEESETETKTPAQGKSKTPQDAPQQDKEDLSADEKKIISQLVPKDATALLVEENLPAELSFAEDKLTVETKEVPKDNFVEEELPDNPTEFLAASSMNYFFLMSTETLLATKSVAEMPKVDGAQNLMTLMPQTGNDNAQSMLNMLGSRSWRPIDIQPTIQVQPQPTVEVQNIVNQPIVQAQAQSSVIQPRADERSAQQIFSEMLGVNVQVEEAPKTAPITLPQSPPQNFEQDSRQQDTQQNFRQQNFQPTVSDAPQVQQVSTGGEIFATNLTATGDTPQIQQATPAQAPDAPPQTPQDNFDVPAQIVRQARLIRTTENTQMVIKLNPEHLGELTLRVSVSQNGAVNASFHSDNAQVRTIIENSLVQLRQELNNAGLKVENVQVYAGLSDGGLSNGQGGQAWQQNRQQRQGNRRINFNTLEREVDNAQPVNESSATDGVDYSV